jgi:hypothetical protein
LKRIKEKERETDERKEKWTEGKIERSKRERKEELGVETLRM